VSTSEQDKARQHAENMAAAARHGWAVTEYGDHGRSASMFAGKGGGAARSDYRRLSADIRTGLVDVVIVHDVSRADRQLETWAPLLAMCRRNGVAVYVTSEDETYDLSKPNHWAALAGAGIQAEKESLVKSAQIRSGKAQWASKGHPAGGMHYGIRRIKDPDKTRNAWLRNEPHPDTGPVVARIIAEVAAGRPYVHVARDLDRDGIPTPGKATSWHGSTVASIAGNEMYAGVVVPEELSLAARARQARDRQRARDGKVTRPGRQVHRYSGALSCGRCGGPVVGYTATNGRGRYRCKAGCMSIDSAAVDLFIDTWAVARLSRPDYIDLVHQGGDSAAAAAARSEAATLQAELDEMAAVASPRAYAIREAATLPRIAAALRRAEEAEAPSALAGLPDANRAVVEQRWNALETSARRAAIRALAPFAILQPGTRGHSSTGTGRHGSGTPLAERIVMRPDGL
jgi:DNA invertase Pin-like site-specific DNA recombinase